MNQHNTLKGFTLIEIIVVVAIVGILAAIAYPTYLDQTRKNRRSSALDAITNIQTELTRCYYNLGGYECCDDNDANDVFNKVLAAPPNTDDGAYQITLAMTNVDGNQFGCKTAQGYTLTATVIPGQAQDGDNCVSFTVDHLGNRTALDPGAVLKPSCWADL